MSSTTPVQFPQQPPPVVVMAQRAHMARPPHGSVAPVIEVLAVVAVLGAIAGVIGRLCSGRRIMGRVWCDVESWADTKCSSCIDGSVDAPSQRTSGTVDDIDTANGSSGEGDAAAAGETVVGGMSRQKPRERADAGGGPVMP